MYRQSKLRCGLKMARPDPEHDAVCASPARHLLVTAPPGTGKTFLTIRLASQIVPRLQPESQVLVVTFSNQARTQLEREAAIRLHPDVRRRVHVTNYHCFFWRAVCSYRRALGLPMEIDVGSRKRRVLALRAAVEPSALGEIEKQPGLIEALAEHEHAEFRDEMTPDPDLLERLLRAVAAEQAAGRLVFDDLGALFWRLLDRYPSVEAAYRRRFPVVIADEHQDASALQDAVVRRLSASRMIIFADSMQLIHGFRGATDTRLDAHERDCDESLTLSIPHRWHGSQHLGAWLLCLRARLRGEEHAHPLPAEVQIRRTRRQHGFNAVKAAVKYAVANAFREGHRSVAVLALSNSQVASLRQYLCREGFRPRQVGSADFEDARDDIEGLPLLTGSDAIAHRVIDRAGDLIPTLRAAVIAQAHARVGREGVDLYRAGADARLILQPLQMLYERDGARYFEAVVAIVDAAQKAGHHAPRVEALLALRKTVDALAGEAHDLQDAILHYGHQASTAAHTAPRTDRGLLVMTAHQGKGKEFDCVVLADVSQRFFPDTPESRRLFYVSMTRASKKWVVIAPDTQTSPLVAFLEDN